MVYLRTLVGVVGAVALAQLLSPTKKQKKYVNTACALLVLLAVVAPFKDGFSFSLPIFSIEGAQTQGQDGEQNAAILALEDALALYLAEELGIARADVSVKVQGDLSGDVFTPTSVVAQIYGGFDENRAYLLLKQAVKNDCEVRVIAGGKGLY